MVAVACFLPGRAKDLSAPPYLYIYAPLSLYTYLHLSVSVCFSIPSSPPVSVSPSISLPAYHLSVCSSVYISLYSRLANCKLSYVSERLRELRQDLYTIPRLSLHNAVSLTVQSSHLYANRIKLHVRQTNRMININTAIGLTFVLVGNMPLNFLVTGNEIRSIAFPNMRNSVVYERRY